jgi:phospholipase C
VSLPAAAHDNNDAPTKTPIKHLVVIFQENRSFDHYFATYPRAANLPGETPFHAGKDTPRVNGLDDALLNPNPNSAQPARLSPAQAITCSHSHDYTDEQKAFDEGLMDLFPEHTGDASCDANQVVDYFDGNTVTALWNYAQNFAISDNSYNTSFGPSTVGALNLISGQTHGINASIGDISGDFVNGTTVVGDADPLYDNCASPDQVALGGKNIGDLLNAKGVTWGWFSGGFKNCKQAHPQPQGGTRNDYVPHHEPFQYYQRTANPNHLRPSSPHSLTTRETKPITSTTPTISGRLPRSKICRLSVSSRLWLTKTAIRDTQLRCWSNNSLQISSTVCNRSTNCRGSRSSWRGMTVVDGTTTS